MIAASPVTTAALLGLDRNGITWCDLTLNPGLAGCEKISPACKDCYAEDTAAGIVRKGTAEKSAPGMRATAAFYAEGLTPDGRWTGRVSVHPERIGPAFAKLPKRPGARRLRVFVTSMSDLFHVDVPTSFLDAVFAEMASRPWIDFLVLTKRAEIMFRYAEWRTRNGWTWPANVWAGVTVEDQRRADERIPWLLQVPAAVRWLSVEPMLSGIDLSDWMERIDHCDDCGAENPPQGPDRCPECGREGTLISTWGHAQAERYRTGERYDEDSEEGRRDLAGERPRLDWIVIGSESDGNRPGARETQPEWITWLVEQCDVAAVPVFVKQAAVNGRLCKLPLVNGRVRADFPEVSPA